MHKLKTLTSMEGMVTESQRSQNIFPTRSGSHGATGVDGRDTEETVAMKTPSSRYSSSPEAWKALLSAHPYARTAMQIQVSSLLLG